jgi:hypothetical protein
MFTVQLCHIEAEENGWRSLSQSMPLKACLSTQYVQQTCNHIQEVFSVPAVNRIASNPSHSGLTQ